MATPTKSSSQRRLNQIMKFLAAIEPMKTIERRVFTSNLERRESDADHSWHLGLFVWLLAGEIDPTLDGLKLLKLVLIHDIVEVDAGDVSTFDQAGRVNKHEREAVAANRLFQLLPPDRAAEFLGLFDEFEAGETQEAQFARMIDKLQPILQNVLSQGKGWQTEQIDRVTVDEHKRQFMERYPAVLAIYERLLDDAQRNNFFKASHENS